MIPCLVRVFSISADHNYQTEEAFLIQWLALKLFPLLHLYCYILQQNYVSLYGN